MIFEIKPKGDHYVLLGDGEELSEHPTMEDAKEEENEYV